MKKLYTLFLGAAVALSASASALAPQPIASKMAKPEKQMVEKLSLKSFSKKAPSKIGANVTIDEIAGEYEWTYTSALGDGGNAVGTAVLAIKDADAGVLSLTLGNWTIEATFSKGNLSIAPGQDLGYNQANKMQVYTYHWHWVPNGNDYTPSPLDTPMIGSASFDDNDNVIIEFDEDDILLVGNEAVGFFIGAYNNKFAPESEWEDRLMPAEGWVKYDTATFTDGWQISGYNQDPANFPYDVVVEKNTAAEYDGAELYRIVNPYGEGTPLFENNEDPNGGQGYIMFSLQLPEFVMAYPATYSGLTDEYGEYLNCNLEGWGYIFGDQLLEKEDWTLQELIQTLGLTELSTYEKNLVTFNNCVFGTKQQPTATYTWRDQQGNPIIFPSTLTFKGENGVDNVAADFDSTVEYYNLQGMRVENPTNGIYIKKENGKTFKVRVVR